MKSELLSWIPIIILMIGAFFAYQYGTEKQAETERREAAIEAREKVQNEARAVEKAAEIKRLSDELNGRGCAIDYSDWSLCMPDGTQMRLVEELPAGCSIGQVTRSCSYTYSPLFDTTMQERTDFVVADVKSRGGSFRYTTYDQASGGQFINSFNLAVVPDTNRLAITRQTIIADSGKLFSDSMLYDGFGAYEPDLVSNFGQPATALNQADPAVAAQYLTLWEQIINQYLFIYAQN